MGYNDHLIVNDPKPKVIRRSIPFDLAEVRIDEDSTTPRIAGYAAVFYDGTRGTEFELWPGMVERIMPGAFDKAVKQDVRGLFNHDESLILGRTGAKTMELRQDKKGLFYSIDVGETNVARDILQHIRRGDVTGSSFSFLITDQTFKTVDKLDIREIRGVDLFDVGPVTFPAYEASTTGVRSEELAEIRSLIAQRRTSTAELLQRAKTHSLTQRTKELQSGSKF